MLPLEDGLSMIRQRRLDSQTVGTRMRFEEAQGLPNTVASTAPNRAVFIDSLVSFMRKYGLDGVDIDWEYPAATDRGGIKADTDNYVLLMSEIQETFARENPGWEATVTIPTSYWYLRGFDITRLQKYVSWFNVMSYDLVSDHVVRRQAFLKG